MTKRLWPFSSIQLRSEDYPPPHLNPFPRQPPTPLPCLWQLCTVLKAELTLNYLFFIFTATILHRIFVRFVVINPRVLSANRVDFGFFVSEIFLFHFLSPQIEENSFIYMSQLSAVLILLTMLCFVLLKLASLKLNEPFLEATSSGAMLLMQNSKVGSLNYSLYII